MRHRIGAKPELAGRPLFILVVFLSLPFSAGCEGAIGTHGLKPSPSDVGDAGNVIRSLEDTGVAPPTAPDGGSPPSNPTQCATGTADCDSDTTNGCEADITGSDAHCGACGRACLNGERCSESVCVAPPSLGETHSFSGGLAHACAIADGGSVWCWGWGTRGQLGNGSNSSSDRPVQVRDLGGIVDLQSRDNTTCARNSAGDLWCWGQNENGETGDDSGNNRNIPVAIELPPVTALGIGLDHACAVSTDGTAYCWGSRADGKRGQGNSDASPAEVDGISGAVAIDAGNDHTCALDSAGRMFCWGDNGFGQLGDGTTQNHSDPGSPIDLDSPVVEIAVGRRTSCARVETGAVYCWGANNYGEVGSGSSADEVHTPTQVQGLDGLDVIDVNCGGHFACALGRSGELRCWGDSRSGQQGRETRSILSAETVDAVGTVNAFDGGGHHLCVGVGTEVRCLGKDDQGQLLGRGDRTSPITIPL